MHTKNLYLLVTALLISGYSWLFWYNNYSLSNPGFTACIFKTCTGLPCPSCGTTRSVANIFKGNIYDGFIINPLGLPVAILMLVLPAWVCFDIILKKTTLAHTFKKTEEIIKARPVAIILIIAIVANWIWNMYKNL